MKVNSQQLNSNTKATKTKKELTVIEKKAIEQEKVKARLQAKFGKDFKKKEVKEDVELNSKGVKNSNEKDFGDIASNDPNSSATQEKLKHILKRGGFEFNQKERKALASILK